MSKQPKPLSPEDLGELVRTLQAHSAMGRLQRDEVAQAIEILQAHGYVISKGEPITDGSLRASA